MLLKKTNFLLSNILQFGRFRISGRNCTGQITIWHRGGAVSRIFRIIDFLNYIWNVRAVIIAFNYDPNRTAILSTLCYTNSIFSFTLAVQNCNFISMVAAINTAPAYEDRPGYTAYLRFIRPGIHINKFELQPLRGSKYSRAGSSFAKLVSTSSDYSIIKLRSRVLIRLSNRVSAAIGVLTNKLQDALGLDINNNCAGYSRRVGRRPVVRGVAMNPIDHPHGGGQGKTSGGRVSVTP